eukprot:432989-Amphidinium_carterae.1
MPGFAAAVRSAAVMRSIWRRRCAVLVGIQATGHERSGSECAPYDSQSVGNGCASIARGSTQQSERGLVRVPRTSRHALS